MSFRFYSRPRLYRPLVVRQGIVVYIPPFNAMHFLLGSFLGNCAEQCITHEINYTNSGGILFYFSQSVVRLRLVCAFSYDSASDEADIMNEP
jgi:hypothetical protein